MALTYRDDILSEVKAEAGAMSGFKWPWKDVDEGLDRESELESRFNTYLNVVSSTAMGSGGPPADSSPQDAAGKKKSILFSPELTHVRSIEAKLLDFSTTHGTKPGGQKRGPMPIQTPLQRVVYDCGCSGNQCSGKPMNIMLPERHLPIQYLPAVRAIEETTRSWVKPLDWASPADWENPFKRKEACKTIAVGFHCWVLHEDARGLTQFIFRDYQSKLVWLKTALGEYVEGLQVLKQVETESPGIVAEVAADPSHPGSTTKLVHRGRRVTLGILLKAIPRKQDKVRKARDEALEAGDMLTRMARWHRGIATAVKIDVFWLKDLLEKQQPDADGLRVCATRFSDVDTVLYEAVECVMQLRSTIEDDAAWLRTLNGYNRDPLPTTRVDISLAIFDVNARLSKAQAVLGRLAEWAMVVRDLGTAYRCFSKPPRTEAPQA
jgi:hypothetical protein